MTNHTFKPSTEITPYLNPGYWNGVMLGHPDPRPTREDASLWSNVKASVWVGEYLQARSSVSPIKTYPEGEDLDPNDYPSGTLFYANRERLLGAKASMAALASIEPYDTELTPPRSISLNVLSIYDAEAEIEDGLSRITHISDPDIGVAYIAVRSFLVVLGNGKRKFLQPVDEHALFRRPDGKTVAIGEVARLEGTVTVGAVDHTDIGIGESLHRINSLVMCRARKPARERARALPSIVRVFSPRTT